MKTNGVTKDGYVYTNFDEVDIVMMVDKTLDSALDDLNMDSSFGRDPMEINPLEEALNMSDAIDHFQDKIEVPKEYIDTRLDPIEMSAKDYIDTYNDIYGNIDYGTMIDIIAGTK